MRTSASYENPKNTAPTLQFERAQQQQEEPQNETGGKRVIEQQQSLESFFAEQPKRNIPMPYVPHKKVVYEMPKEEPDYENMNSDEIDSFFNNESLENEMLSKIQQMFQFNEAGNDENYSNEEDSEEVSVDAFGEIQKKPNTKKLESFFENKNVDYQNIDNPNPINLENINSNPPSNIPSPEEEENEEVDEHETESMENNIENPFKNEPNNIPQVTQPHFSNIGDIQLNIDISSLTENTGNNNGDNGFWDDDSDGNNDGFFDLPPANNINKNQVKTFPEVLHIHSIKVSQDYNQIIPNKEDNLESTTNKPQSQTNSDYTSLNEYNPFSSSNTDENSIIPNKEASPENNDVLNFFDGTENKDENNSQNIEELINTSNSQNENVEHELLIVDNNENQETSANDSNQNDILSEDKESQEKAPVSIPQNPISEEAIQNTNSKDTTQNKESDVSIVRNGSYSQPVKLSINMVSSIDLTNPALEAEEQMIDDFFAEAEQDLFPKQNPIAQQKTHHSHSKESNHEQPSQRSSRHRHRTNSSNDTERENKSKSSKRSQPPPPDVVVSHTQKSAFAPPPARKPGAHIPARLQKKIEPVIEEPTHHRRHHSKK